MLKSTLMAGAVIALALASAAPAWAQAAEEPEGWAYRYFGEVMSPFCPGRTLAACTSGQAESLRMWIMVQEAAGRSRADVHSELLERHGDVILSAPRARGFGVTAYAIPAAIFLAGGLLVVVFLRRQTRASAERAAEAPPAEPLDPEIERIIDEELAR
jgi:cytochrome c-type biogenesis protein CcmH/NrfF